MHARVEQLLSMRDGEPVDAVTRDHIAACASCTAELVRLVTTREQLLSLPMLDPPNELWGQIAERITPIESRYSKSRRGWISVAAAAAVVVSMVTILFHTPNESRVAVRPTDNSSQVELATLVQRSQQLEATLEALPQRPSVERVATAANIDGIEQRIQWLDFHMSAANDALDASQTHQLWQERVDLMDSLVKLRYAEARTAQL